MCRFFSSMSVNLWLWYLSCMYPIAHGFVFWGAVLFGLGVTPDSSQDLCLTLGSKITPGKAQKTFQGFWESTWVGYVPGNHPPLLSGSFSYFQIKIMEMWLGVSTDFTCGGPGSNTSTEISRWIDEMMFLMQNNKIHCHVYSWSKWAHSHSLWGVLAKFTSNCISRGRSPRCGSKIRTQWIRT